jgi:predicted nucleic acid-binding protein
METKNKLIIADSSGIISLAIATDSNHHAAFTLATHLSQEKNSVIIPSEVFAETVNILGKKYGHLTAIRLVETVLSSSVFRINPTADKVRIGALDLFGTVAAGVSYTDCLVMAVADQHGTKTVFGFDTIFRQKGYVLPKP